MTIHGNPPALITMEQIQAEFGGSGALDQYYRGGSYVPNTQQNINIPTSGAIKYSDFYGAAKSEPPAQTEAFLTSTTSYTFPAGTAPFNFYLNVLGAGGGGGGVGTEQLVGGGGGGGGAGGFVQNYPIPVDPSVSDQVVTINIGAGGIANYSGATAGGDSYVTVNGVEVYRVSGGGAGGNASPYIPPGSGGELAGGSAGLGGSGGASGTAGGNGEVGPTGDGSGAGSGNGGNGGDTPYGNGGEGGQQFASSLAVWDGPSMELEGGPGGTYQLNQGDMISIGGDNFGAAGGFTGGGGGGSFTNDGYGPGASSQTPYWYGGAGGQGFAIISYPALNDSLGYESTLENNATAAINARTADQATNAQAVYVWTYVVDNNPEYNSP